MARSACARLQDHAAALRAARAGAPGWRAVSASDGEQDAPAVQVRGTVLSDAAGRCLPRADGGRPGHRGALPARPVRRARGRRRGLLDAAAPRVLHPPTSARTTAARWSSCSPPSGRGTRWLAERRTHDPIDVVGPLGRPFALPRDPVSCLLVGGGYGSAPLFALADQLRSRGCRVDFVLGAASGGPAVRRARPRGGPASPPRSPPRTARWASAAGSPTCSPRSSMRPAPTWSTPADRWACCAGDHAGRAGTTSRCDAVEESMACGIGVCMTCVLPVVGDDGVTRMVRSCVDGPVFRGDAVRWDDVGTVPVDALGAPGWTRGRRQPASAAQEGTDDPDDAACRLDAAGGARARRGMAVDMLARLGPLSCPTRSSPRPGAPAAGRELDQFFDVTKLGAVVTKSIMRGPAVRPPDAADGRDAERDAQLDRPAGTGHRRVPASATCRGCAERGARAVVSIAGSERRRVRRAGRPAARRRPGRCHRGQHLLPERRGPRSGLRLRPGVRVRGGHRAVRARRPAMTSRSSPSCRRTSPTSSRSPGPA